MNRTAMILALSAGMAPMSGGAVTLEFPSVAISTARDVRDNSTESIPVDSFRNGGIETEIASGSVLTQGWRLPEVGLSTTQILAPLRNQLTDLGYQIKLDCDSQQCGGFDFRFNINILPEPEMHVDLGDYRFLSAVKANEGTPDEFVTLMVSRSAGTGFVEMKHIGEPTEVAGTVVTSSKTPDAASPTTTVVPDALTDRLVSLGRAPLEDLSFQTGSARLGDDVFASLQELSAYLLANPDKTIALVGHTDAQGSLDANLALSKRRAMSVLNRLVAEFQVPRRQMEAAGVGYLAPRASNLTDDGRTKNRRVEVIITSTQ